MRSAAGVNSSDIKQRNISAILLHLLRNGSASRVLLAQQIGVSTATITNLVSELVALGLIADDGLVRDLESAAPVGRPQRALKLIPTARCAVGVHIDVGRVHVALVDLIGAPLATTSFEHRLDAPWQTVLDRAASETERLCQQHAVEPERIVGAGVAASGLVDPVSGVNTLSPNLHWYDVPIRTHMAERLQRPIAVENNVRAMALGESMFGSGRDLRAMAFIYARVGVGAGLVVDGQIYRGADAGAGEIGHTALVVQSRQGRPTVQSLEALFSRQALLDAARALGRPEMAALDDIFTAAAGDADLQAMLEERAFYFGLALANLVDLFNPELIVLGGLFLHERGTLLPTIERTMRAHAFGTLGRRVRLQLTELGDQAGMIGAAALALDSFLYRPQPLAAKGGLS